MALTTGREAAWREPGQHPGQTVSASTQPHAPTCSRRAAAITTIAMLLVLGRSLDTFAQIAREHANSLISPEDIIAPGQVNAQVAAALSHGEAPRRPSSDDPIHDSPTGPEDTRTTLQSKPMMRPSPR